MITLFFLLSFLVSVAFFTLVERKILGYCAIRVGANKPSVMGILTPFADAVKLLLKSAMKANFLFGFSASMVIVLALGFLMVFLNQGWFFFETLICFCIFSVTGVVFFLMGWSSGSYYGVYGGVRSLAQSISYEILLYFILLLPLLYSTFINYEMMTPGLLFFSLPIWLIVVLAESNRSPFDEVEGESELVSGFNVEFSGLGFVFLFLGEYCLMVSISVFTGWFFFDTFLVSVIVMILMIMVRASYPRIRYDFLMILLWGQLLVILMLMIGTIF